MIRPVDEEENIVTADLDINHGRKFTPQERADMVVGYVSTDDGIVLVSPEDLKQCTCEGPYTQTIHERNAEGHQVGCPRWGITRD